MRLLLSFAFCSFLVYSNAQTNVGIGTPAPSNRLHVLSTADPLRLEGVTSGAATDSIVTITATGVVKRRTVASVFSGGTGWLLTGNALATNTGTSFLGSTNLSSLFFRTNNQRSGFIDFDSTKRNNSFGNRALLNPTTGIGNNAFGYQALSAVNTGNNNVAIGDSTAFNLTSGTDNVLLGADAGILLTGGSQNIAIGSRSLAAGVFASDNVAIGTRTLENNVAAGNIAVGTQALNKNNVGSDNIAIGTNALSQNVGAANINIAIGNGALSNTITSTEQVALGYNAGLNIATGSYNTLIGHYALSGAFTAATNYNTVLGYQAGANQTSGSNNTYLGYQTGGSILTGSNNTFIGYLAGSTSSTPVSANVSNTVVIGSGSGATASNLVRLGNTSTTVIGGSVSYSVVSDERVKTNIREDVKGLSFISLLRPVTYNYNLQKIDDIQKIPLAARTSYAEKQGIRYTGFLAQEVEAAAQKTGYEFSGVNKPKNEQSLYSISYSEIVVPLVKAVQELKAMVEKQQQEIEKLKAQIQTTDNGRQTTK